MTEKENTIECLFSDSGPFDEAQVVRALRAHVTIQRSTSRIFFKNSPLATDRKILAYGLAKKLLASKGILPTEMITAQEFHEATGIKKGTVDPSFKTLKDRGLLVGKGEYEIPAGRISSAIEMLSTDGAN